MLRKVTASILFLSISLFLIVMIHPKIIYNFLHDPLETLGFCKDCWQDDNRPTLIYAIPPKFFIGETEVMTSLLLTAKNMGWNIVENKKSNQLPKEKLQQAFGIAILSSNPMDYDHFPENTPLIIINPLVSKQAATAPLQNLRSLLNLSPHRSIDKRIQGLLLTNFQTIDMDVKTTTEIPNLKFLMHWYFTYPSTFYQPNPQKLMFFGAKYHSNIRTESKKYLDLWQKLDATDYFTLYGEKSNWQNYQSYKGYVAADGKSFVQEIHKNGICLLLHGENHLKEGVPSARIFEAAAAAAVIISDKHPFVEKEFGDAVLYIDQEREDLFEQIDAHMQWIKNHPEEAKNKARLAHAIFLQKFTLEQQLARLYQKVQQLRPLE